MTALTCCHFVCSWAFSFCCAPLCHFTAAHRLPSPLSVHGTCLHMMPCIPSSVVVLLITPCPCVSLLLCCLTVAGKLVTVFSAPDYPQFLPDSEPRFNNKVRGSLQLPAICCVAAAGSGLTGLYIVLLLASHRGPGPLIQLVIGYITV